MWLCLWLLIGGVRNTLNLYLYIHRVTDVCDVKEHGRRQSYFDLYLKCLSDGVAKQNIFIHTWNVLLLVLLNRTYFQIIIGNTGLILTDFCFEFLAHTCIPVSVDQYYLCLAPNVDQYYLCLAPNLMFGQPGCVLYECICTFKWVHHYPYECILTLPQCCACTGLKNKNKKLEFKGDPRQRRVVSSFIS